MLGSFGRSSTRRAYVHSLDNVVASTFRAYAHKVDERFGRSRPGIQFDFSRGDSHFATPGLLELTLARCWDRSVGHQRGAPTCILLMTWSHQLSARTRIKLMSDSVVADLEFNSTSPEAIAISRRQACSN